MNEFGIRFGISNDFICPHLPVDSSAAQKGCSTMPRWHGLASHQKSRKVDSWSLLTYDSAVNLDQVKRLGFHQQLHRIFVKRKYECSKVLTGESNEALPTAIYNYIDFRKTILTKSMNDVQFYNIRHIKIIKWRRYCWGGTSGVQSADFGMRSCMGVSSFSSLVRHSTLIQIDGSLQHRYGIVWSWCVMVVGLPALKYCDSDEASWQPSMWPNTSPIISLVWKLQTQEFAPLPTRHQHRGCIFPLQQVGHTA